MGPAAQLVATPPAQAPYLACTAERLELRQAGLLPLFVDFHGAEVKRRLRAGRRSPLARALGLHRRPDTSVLDATCGLGRDAAVLLGLDCRVAGIERSPLLHAMLQDGLERAAPLPGWGGLIGADAVDWLDAQSAPVADAIYLDPMFAGHGKALPKKAMQLLRQVVGADPDAPALLAAARRAAAARVVVKRHPRGRPLAPPDYSISGQRAAFDVYRSAAPTAILAPHPGTE